MLSPASRAAIETAAALQFGPPRFPRFDCPTCVYVGGTDHREQYNDRYYCMVQGEPALVFREAPDDEQHSGGRLSIFLHNYRQGTETAFTPILCLLDDFGLLPPC